MKKGLKIAAFIFVGIIIILIFLNPNTASFKNYAHNFGDNPHTTYKRIANYFLFSKYVKQEYEDVKEYYGFAGNFFKVEQKTQPMEVIVQSDSVTKIVADTILDYGPNAHVWMDDLGAYFNKNPNASDEELYKRFPHLDYNERKLIEGVWY
jgi:hypothetical protein